jgi:hypothetical protein
VSFALMRRGCSCWAERRASAHLALDLHPFSYEGHAGSGVGGPVHPDEAIETCSHAAVNAPGHAPSGEPGHEAFLGHEHCCHGFTRKGSHFAAVNGEVHWPAAGDPVAVPEREAAAANQLHAAILAPLRSRLAHLRMLSSTGALEP